MKRLTLKCAIAVLAAFLAMFLLHVSYFWITGRVAGPFLSNLIWAITMCIGLVLPLRFVDQYKRRKK